MEFFSLVLNEIKAYRVTWNDFRKSLLKRDEFFVLIAAQVIFDGYFSFSSHYFHLDVRSSDS